MQTTDAPAAEDIRATISEFISSASRPALFEPGEDLFPITAENFSMEMRGSRLTLQAWDRTRNLTRRILRISKRDAGRLELAVERFARREGPLYLVDLGRRVGADAGRRSARLVFRERFRLFLRRQFPQWKLAELSAEGNLQYSLSPAFPRGFLRYGNTGWAAIACPPDGDAAATLTFGLIWLSYLRSRESRLTIEGLAIYLPAGHERSAARRALCLNPAAAKFAIFSYTGDDQVDTVDPADYGNLDTRIEPFAAPDLRERGALFHRLSALPGVECVPQRLGSVSVRIRGMEFAELRDGRLFFGLQERRLALDHHAQEIERIADELNRARNADTEDRGHPLYRVSPEAWLESLARAEIQTLDASLLPSPIYGQTPVIAAGERGMIDLLAVDRTGRLAVVELKASADPHLPLQALDYWIHVKWHLDRNGFGGAGYFPETQLRPEPPRLLLAAPALEFHPATEVILRYFSPFIEVERVGLAAGWRSGLRTVFRLRGAENPR